MWQHFFYESSLGSADSISSALWLQNCSHSWHVFLLESQFEPDNPSNETTFPIKLLYICFNCLRFLFWISNLPYFKLQIQQIIKYRAYNQSKLANILHSNELARRLKVLNAVKVYCICPYLYNTFRNDMHYFLSKQEEGVKITANSLHPGEIFTNLLRNVHSFFQCKLHQSAVPLRLHISHFLTLQCWSLQFLGLTQVFSRRCPCWVCLCLKLLTRYFLCSSVGLFFEWCYMNHIHWLNYRLSL